MALWHVGDNFTSDIVVIVGRGADAELLLIRRKHEPFKDAWALPGGFVNSQTPAGERFEFAETHLQAAQRELLEETGIEVRLEDFRLIGVYDAWGRDPRAEGDQRVVTQAFLVVLPEKPIIQAGDDAADARWLNLNFVLSGVVSLAFDHQKMVKQVALMLSQDASRFT